MKKAAEKATSKKAAPKMMTKNQLVAHMSESCELTKKQVQTFFEELAQVGYREAKKGFTLPGFGKLVIQKRKARTGRNPSTGETIKIPAKTVVKFRIAKACKDAIIPPPKK
ncbi:MAG: HU family DNA-binding protein [Candidatus Omnitrophota bacterium]|nr:MAG: HU family DNA-binding protein [Candidatus Omnitrophota bacterium]